MSKAIIVGSGPAAVGVALALVDDPAEDVTVLDIGTRLEPSLVDTASRLSAAHPTSWPTADVAAISVQPVDSTPHGLPEKRAYGSDFPFRDLGQVDGVRAAQGENVRLVSGAFGGFSNVWGSQTMPFTAASFDAWPISAREMEKHYRAILRHIPFTGEHDDLETLFPLYGEGQRLPQLADRTRMVLAAYERHRPALNRMGVLAGRARLAVRADECVRCGLCMTGCPYRLVYSASHSFEALIAQRRITYVPDLLVCRVTDSRTAASVVARELSTGQVHRFTADRVFVAAGAVGSTRIAVNSLKLYDEDVYLKESAQFTLPALSARRTPDPRLSSDFTLNQWNMVVDLGRDGLDISQTHFYPYNPAMFDALPAPLRGRLAEPMTKEVLRRLSVGIGYLPSWASPGLRMRAEQPTSPDELPRLMVTGKTTSFQDNPMFRKVTRRLVQAAPRLDLWPMLPLATFSAPGKSYHWGGSFPLTGRGSPGRNHTDRLGRPGGWERVHLVDAAVFPTVPATTFTLTIMANAHRIATEARSL